MDVIVESLMMVVVVALVVLLVRQKRRHRGELVLRENLNREVRANFLNERDELLDTLGDSFMLVDETGRIVFANACARRLVKGRKLMGRSLTEAFLDDQLSAWVADCIRTGKPMSERIVFQSSFTPLGGVGENGTSAWVVDAAPISGRGDERITRVVMRDVSAEHQAEQVRRDFVANASHELRTPMAIINGYLENLIDDDVVDDAIMARKFLMTMRKHGQRISRLVEDMLMISRMESGEALALSEGDFLIGECIADVLDRLDSMIAAQQAEVSTEIDPIRLAISGDGFYWTQVVFNLVENALKQNPSPGLKIVIRAVREVDRTEISVCDDGIGIPSEDLPFVFKRFYRVEKHHTQSAAKGTGLGLSIVKRVVEAHGGQIAATSTPGVQTCFTISLPTETVG